MVNLISAVRPFLHTLMKLAGLSPRKLKLGQDTVINIWAPKGAHRVKPDKPAIVLAQPFNGDGMLMWFPQMLALSGAYDVYVPDFLFFGGSTTTTGDCSPEFQAACVAECLGVLGVDRCTVVGLSYGGMVGFKMAKLYPSLVENLVVSSTVTELTRSVSERAWEELGVGSWAEFLLPESVEGVKKLFRIGTHEFMWLPDFIYKHFLEALFDNRKEKVELLEALVVNDKDSTTNYHQRIHFLWGDNDKIFNLALAQAMKEKIGDKASLERIKNAGHLLHLERPFAYNKELKRILALFYPNSR